MDLSKALRALGVPFDPGANLQVLWQAVLAFIDALKAGTYHTPGTSSAGWPTPQTITMDAFNPSIVAGLGAAMNNYFAALRSGIVPAVCMAVDQVNQIRRPLGYPDLVPPPAIDILRNSGGPLGDLARNLYQAQANSDTPLPILEAATIDVALANAIAAAQPAQGPVSYIFPGAH